MPRTIVISDMHGDELRLTETLAHAGFGPDDRLIIAGDLIDVGTDDVIARAGELGAEVLAGNHEVSAALGLRIWPQNAESLVRGEEFAARMRDGEWKLATVVDGWLVTHAGVSAALSDLIIRFGPSPETIADGLNELFRDEITRASGKRPLDWPDLEAYRLLGGQMGPLWFRPQRMSDVPSGLFQIVGHSPPEMFTTDHLRALEAAGWRLVEPGGHGGALARSEVIDGRVMNPSVRYAVIDGGATVVEE